jgi:hypothetical protein
MRARVSRKLHDRNERLPWAIRDIAWKAQVRLCARYRRLSAAGKPKVIVTTAIAREMVGFLGAIDTRCPEQEKGLRGGNLVTYYEPACRRSSFRPRQPQDETTIMR